MQDAFTAGLNPIPSEDVTMRRQSWITWGMLAAAVFLAVGMGEWSKHMAMAEKVVSPQLMERALVLAEKMEDRARVNVNVNESGNEAAKIQTSAGVEK